MASENQPFPSGPPCELLPPYPGTPQTPILADVEPPPGAVPPPGQACPVRHQPTGAGYHSVLAGDTQPEMPLVLPDIAGPPIAVQPASVVVFAQPDMFFRQSPVICVCPHCHQNIITSTAAEAGGLTWLLCVGLVLVGLWLGCCLIPFCVDAWKDIIHSCPNCKKIIHVFNRMKI